VVVDDVARWHRLLRAALLLIAIVTGCTTAPAGPDQPPGTVKPSAGQPDGQADPGVPPVRTSAAPARWGGAPRVV
jgi:hypothetical protein